MRRRTGSSLPRTLVGIAFLAVVGIFFARQLHEQLLQEESTKSLARARRPTNLGVNQNLQHGQALVHGPSPASGVEKEDDHAGKRGNGVGFPTFGEGTANASEAECKVTQPALEEEWIRYFRDSPWTTRPCEHAPTLASLRTSPDNSHPLLVPRPSACPGGVLHYIFVDPLTANVTSEQVDADTPLRSDSGILECSEAASSPLHNLVLHPLVDPRIVHQVEAAEARYREWREGLEQGQRSKVASARPNILFVMVDSLSRYQALRGLSKTMSLLDELNRSQASTHEVFHMTKANVVGPGTHSNVPAFLAGYTNKDLPGAYPDADIAAKDWILNLAGRNGYATAFVDHEQVSSKSSMPRVRMKSYESGESDQIHFDARKVAAVMAHHSVSAIFDEVLKKGRDPEVTSWGAAADRFCFGGRLIFSALADYVRDFWAAYQGGPKLVYFAPMDAHDPSMLRVRTIDEPLRDLVRDITTSSSTDSQRETILILAGDHGPWYGGYFERSRAARQEVKTPALLLLIPRKMLDRLGGGVREALSQNQHRLTTNYDVHATLRHILELHNSAAPRRQGDSRPPHGISLLSPILPRSCSAANIPSEFCACTEFVELSDTELASPYFRSLAELAAHSIRSQVQQAVGTDGARKTTSCVELRFDSIQSAQKMQTELVGNTRRDQLVTMRFQTAAGPGYGPEIFEAVISHRLSVVPDPDLEKPLSLKKLMLGTRYNETTASFEQEGMVLVPRAGQGAPQDVAIYVAEQWRRVAYSEDRMMAMEWVNPSGSTFLLSTHVVKATWTSSWQRRSLPLDPERGGGEGLWTLKLHEVASMQGTRRDFKLRNAIAHEGLELGSSLGLAHFYISSHLPSDAFPSLPASISALFWDVERVTRVTGYQKHAHCRDMRVRPDFCVCL